MKEEQIIQNSKIAYAKDDIKKDLFSMGIEEGDVLLVHSSLSKIGWVIGKEIAVIQALLESVGESGTIVMPSQSGDWTSPEYWQNPPVPHVWIEKIKNSIPAYNPLYTPTREMGRIADAFYRYPNSIRSSHPHVSFSANGKLAQEIVGNHSLSYGLGEGSPLQKLYDLDAKVLLLGVGYDKCTSMHLAEAKQEYKLIEKQGSKLESGWTEFEEIVYDDSDFETIGMDFEKENHVVKGMVGQANCRVFSIRSVVDFANQWIFDHRKCLVTLSKEQFSEIYKSRMIHDFPDNELKDLGTILNNPNSYLFGYFDQKLVGYANCVFQEKYCLLDYYGIFVEERNKGYGSAFLKNLWDQFENKTWIIESEVPYDHLSSRRLEFYQRNGWILSDIKIELYGVDYHILSNKIISKEEIEYAYSLYYPSRFRKLHFKVYS